MTLRFKTLLTAASLIALMAGGALAETVLDRGNNGDPETLDPHKNSTIPEANLMRDLFMGLTMHDGAANLIPGAAESWSVSEDGKVWTFKLRPGALWSDGTPVTAADFVWSWQRVVSPATAAEYAYMLAPVLNAEAITKGEKPATDLGVRAVDATTLEVTLKAPTPYFLEMLTHQATYPLQRADVEKYGADFTKPGNLVSNGAYVLDSFVPNDHISLVKNPKFYDAEHVAFDRVNFYPTEDATAAVRRFEAGELDMMLDFPAEQTAALKETLGERVKIGPTLATYYYGFKLDKAPWSDPEIRKAVSMAIDRDYLAEEVWQNTMIPAYTLVPPGIAGYAVTPPDWAGLSQIDREDQARAILERHGYTEANPLKMEIRFNTNENNANTAVALQELLKPMGIAVTMVNLDIAAHYAHLEQKGDFDAARAAWFADYKDPENFLSLCTTGAGNNYSLYSNAEYDAMLQAAAVEPDAAKRMDLLAKAETKGVIEDQCVMPLMFYSYRGLVSDKLAGWQANSLDVHPSRFLSPAE
ncbi:peptide ABC transporter substrate-binding protein [Rhodobacter capsulatus]|uniref:peptide ABC transporter substrate-binding protein n=1 Tax=Rhodobacter capsulatus TaxID=1061 RepID=UPI0003D2B7CA|nr:peptide ABC transporter substrate-binding protein [Rhodobacter capsulatus]ETD81388.1 ABC transporter substrate-binding protein [Rhodobacter capsulatus YW1]